MGKRLTLILALAFVVGITCAAYAEVQNVKVSGDITVIGATRELDLDNGNSGATLDDDKDQFIASITRLRVDADLTDMVSATVRLINERLWGEGDGSQSDNASDIDLDLAYVTLKEFLYSPLTLTIGLQGLRFGNAMIVGDPDTNNVSPTESMFNSSSGANQGDLSQRKAFEAIRATLNYDPLVVDLVTAKVSEYDVNKQDDHDLYGVNLNYKVDDNTVAEGYYFLKYYGREGFSTVGGFRKPFRIDTIGGRVQTSVTDNLTYHLEAAWQLGKGAIDSTPDLVRSSKRQAFALETAAAMNFKDTKYVPSLTALYAYFSGQKGDVNKKIKAWDPMYEDQKFGDIANAQFPQSNAHILGVIGTMKPADDVTIMGEYYAYWWDKKYGDAESITSVRGDSLIMKHEKYAGSELDLKAIYDYTEDVQLALMTGLFFPGGSFDKRNRNVASEVIGSMKVTF